MPATNRNYEIDIEDVEYLRHENKPLLARMFKPRGQGPFPAIIDLHGGAWNLGDRLMDTPINEPLAKSGVVVMALDFRMPPEAPYPASMADINYAVRWFKAHAGQFGSRPDLSRTDREFERRSSGNAGRDATGRSEVFVDPASRPTLQRSMLPCAARFCAGRSSIRSGAIATPRS